MSSDLSLKILSYHKTAAKLILAFLLLPFLSANPHPHLRFSPRRVQPRRQREAVTCGSRLGAVLPCRWAGQGGTHASLRPEVVRPGVQGSQGTRHRTPVPRRRAEVGGRRGGQGGQRKGRIPLLPLLPATAEPACHPQS